MSTLTINDAVKEDAGEYMIKAENDKGVIEFTVNIIIGKASEMEIVESTRTVTVTEQTIVDGEVTESVVKKEETVEKMVDGEVTVDTTVTEAKMTEPTETKVEEIVQEEKVEVVESQEVKAEVKETAVEGKTVETVVESKVEEIEVSTEVEAEPAPEEDTGAPKMELAPKPVVVDVGETIKISCKFTGKNFPLPMLFVDRYHYYSFSLYLECSC